VEPDELTLADLPGRAARLSPSRAAIVTAGARHTYADLLSGVRRAARGLLHLGLTRGDRIGILLPNCLEYVQAFYAIPAALGVTVSVNTFLAPAEVATVLEDSGSRCLITTGRRLASLAPHLDRLPRLEKIVLVSAESGATPALGRSILCRSWEEISSADPDEGEWPRPDPSSVAVLSYTSGTTGRMKGVMLSHANLLANARSCLAAVKLRDEDRLLLFLPMFHSLTQLVCLVVPVLASLSVILLPGVDRAAISSAIRRHRPTIFLAVPAIYAAMAERPPGRLRRWLNPVRLYISGGAPLSMDVLQRFEEGWGRPLCEGYGLSEAAPVVCLNPVDGARKPGSVGLPLPGIEVRIVEDDGAAASAGAIGEILVRGPNVMLGYHERPEETAAALHDDWLHTGDLGRLDGDGYLFIAGRRKEMLICRGMNVYPREVEEVLAAHPAVAEAAVVGMRDQQRGETPHAAVVLRPGATATEKALRSFCLERLARYKVPRSILLMPAFPRNATGKVMKDEIRERLEKDSASSSLSPPEDPDSPDA
jgi:long-chain acyl-CoA synthetase